MSRITLLNELTYDIYETYVYVEFQDTTNVTDVAQVLRSMRYVTVINNKTDKEDKNPRGILLVKVLTTKSPTETFQSIKEEAFKAIPELIKFKFSTQRIVKVDEL